MDKARYTPTDEILWAVRFAALPPSEIAARRFDFVCPLCGVKAFFRKKSTSGQAACFGARHQPGCNMESGPSERVNAAGREVDPLSNLGTAIKLDLNFGAPERTNADISDFDDADGRGGGRRFTGEGPGADAMSTRRLSTVLGLLIEVPEFKDSEIVIHFEDDPARPIREFFVRSELVNDAHFDSPNNFGIWGIVVSADYWENGFYINFGTRKDIKLVLDPAPAKELLSRYHIKSPSELVGCYALGVGVVNKSNQRRNFYSRMQSADYVALHRPNQKNF